jgi:hypothetical protein
LKLDMQGLWINGRLWTDAQNGEMLEEIMKNIRTLNTFSVGSQEGANRSNAIYNYIKYYTYESS